MLSFFSRSNSFAIKISNQSKDSVVTLRVSTNEEAKFFVDKAVVEENFRHQAKFT